VKVGDIVRWIGFPGASPEGVKMTGPSCTGIIVRIYSNHEDDETAYVGGTRIDVVWADGTLGDMLYPQTVEVIIESG